MVRKYKAFISYRHRELDIAVAKKIHKSIERYTIPRDLRKNGQKRLGLVFRDREELPLSSNLTDDIFSALDNSEFLIVVCTPDTPQSLWCRREIQHFIETHGRQRVITVLAAGTPEESIPPEITTVFAEDGVTVLEQYEPLCAYLVDKNPKKVLRNLDKELLRLYAAMLNCPYDSLRQRNKRRKMQQALAIASLAFAVALGFIGMLVNRNMKIQAQNAEIAAQNLEIAAQKRDVQMRESELLTADAREQLDKGNTRQAIEAAVAALPKEGEEDRPYYAPAEGILMEAMDIFSGTESTVLLQDVVLSQMTPISHFHISPDGTRVVTIDDYTVVHCYDAESGEELWMQILTGQSSTTDWKYAQFTGDGTGILFRYGNILERRDAATGEKLWEYDLGGTNYSYFYYDAALEQVALLKSYSTVVEKQFVYLLELIVVSAEDGQVVNTIRLETNDTNLNYCFNNSGEGLLPTNGCFSKDGRYFACGTYTRDYKTDSYDLRCFVVDLQEQQVVCRYQQDTQQERWSPTVLRFREDVLFMGAEPYADTVAGGMWKLNWQTGELLWQTTTPSELDQQLLFTTTQTSHWLIWNSCAYLGRFEKLYAIDLETGEVVSSEALPGCMASLYTVADGEYGFSLHNGIYGIGWFNRTSGLVVTTGSFWYLTVAVPEHDLFMPYGGGVIQYYSDGDLVEISVSNKVQPGYIAVVDSDANNQLVIKRPVTVERNLENYRIEIPVDGTVTAYSENNLVELDGNGIILGRISYRDSENEYRNVNAVLDRENHTIRELYKVEYSLYGKYFYLPDGSGYVQLNDDGTTSLCRDGNLTTMTTVNDPSYPEEDQYWLSKMISAESGYLADGTVLTVKLGLNTMSIFRNGEVALTGVLPDAFRHHQGESFQNREALVGRNGLVISWFENYQGPIETLCVLDANTGTWLDPAWKVSFGNENAVAFAEANPWIAIVDADHMVRVRDAQAGEDLSVFSLGLPQGSVMHMDFLLDDSCLMVKSRDADVLIFDVATGEMLYQGKLETTYSGILRTYEDKANQRLYILDSYLNSGINALCIDLNSWTTLGTGENMIYFDEETAEMYYFDRYAEGGAAIYSIRIPSTAELVRFGQELLEESDD